MCIFLESFRFEKESISRKHPVLDPFEKFLSLVLPKNVIMLQHLIIQFPLSYLSSDHLRLVKKLVKK